MNNIHLVTNYIEPEDIKILRSEMDLPSETNPYPEYYSNRNGGTSLPYNKITIDMLKKYGDKSATYMKNFFNINHEIYATKGYGSKWRPGLIGLPHVDDCGLEEFIEWSVVIYLNEPPEFDGGIIYFPEKDFTYIPVTGSALFFPQKDLSYIHGITEVTRGYRYTMLFHYSKNIEFADPDLLDK